MVLLEPPPWLRTFIRSCLQWVASLCASFGGSLHYSVDDPPTGSSRNAEHNFRNEKRSNATHASTTDPDARLYRKSDGQPSRLCFMGHLLIENRHGLIVDVQTTHANGVAEREAAEAMIRAAALGRRVTLGSDKAYDAAEHVAALRAIGVTPHVAAEHVRTALSN